jgi:hypothetical protein
VGTNEKRMIDEIKFRNMNFIKVSSGEQFSKIWEQMFHMKCPKHKLTIVHSNSLVNIPQNVGRNEHKMIKKFLKMSSKCDN